jgi:hypothetical protein
MRRPKPFRRPTSSDRVIAEIGRERRRQIETENWSLAHDDEHAGGQLALAGAAYAMASHLPLLSMNKPQPDVPAIWPWDPEWWKPTNPRRNLIKAAALIVAEIERLDRAE